MRSIIEKTFNERFGGEGTMYASAGRINLIGEHTDYNGGFVFPGAIDKVIMADMRPNGTGRVRVFSIDIDDYELISSSEREYGRQALRRMGANDEVLEAIEGCTDFDRLGSEMMDEDGVRQTGFGLVRRLSKPFPPAQEPDQQMGGLSC